MIWGTFHDLGDGPVGVGGYTKTVRPGSMEPPFGDLLVKVVNALRAAHMIMSDGMLAMNLAKVDHDMLHVHHRSDCTCQLLMCTV